MVKKSKILAMLGRNASNLKTKCTPLICEGIYCVCDFRLSRGVDEMSTRIGCSSHSPFTSPLWSSCSFPRLGQLCFHPPSKSTFISVTLSCSTYFPVDKQAIFPSALVFPAPHCLSAHYVPHPSFSVFSLSLPYFFHVFHSFTWQWPHVQGMLFLVAATWQIYFLPSSDSCMCHQPYRIVSRSLKTSHCPHHSHCICTPICSWHSGTP